MKTKERSDTVRKTSMRKARKCPAKKSYIVGIVNGGKTAFYTDRTENGKLVFDTTRDNAREYSNKKIALKIVDKIKNDIPKTCGVFIDTVSVNKNPVTPSSSAKLKKACDLYEDFTGHKATWYENVRADFPDVALLVGHCDGILYSTVRDNKLEKYIHKFKKNSRPHLVASHDGESLALIGGNFRFTERGIVDD